MIGSLRQSWPRCRRTPVRSAPAGAVRLQSQRFRSRLNATGASNDDRFALLPQGSKTCSNECSNGPEFP